MNLKIFDNHYKQNVNYRLLYTDINKKYESKNNKFLTLAVYCLVINWVNIPKLFFKYSNSFQKETIFCNMKKWKKQNFYMPNEIWKKIVQHKLAEYVINIIFLFLNF